MIAGWKEQMEREYLRVLRDRGAVTPHDVARQLGVSESSAVFWLTELAREGQVRITGIAPAGPPANTRSMRLPVQ